MEAILTRFFDTQEQATEQQSDQSALNIPDKQSTEQPDYENNVHALFTMLNLENAAHHAT